MILVLVTETMFFSPLRIAVLVFWFYLCVYLTQRFEFSAIIPAQYKGWLNLLMLPFAPFVLIAAFAVAVIRKIAEESLTVSEAVVEVFGKTIKHITTQRFSGSRGADSIILLDPSGRSLKEVYGSKNFDAHDIGRTVATVQRIIGDAIQQLASDILINPIGDFEYEIRFRIDGMLRPYETLQENSASAVINSIKAISAMDIAEKRRPQDGAFIAKCPSGTVSFRVASAGVLHGEKLSIRVLNQSQTPLKMPELGMLPRQCQLVDEVLKRDSGMILVCGPTGSGKTTTLYGMLREIDFSSRNVITIEDPVEYILPGASQIEVNQKADITFAKSLRSVLRQDPDVITVGEIRDEETAGIALKSAQTGHLVLATLHSSSSAGAIVRLIDLNVRPLLITSALDLIVSQRLVRRLCDNCKGAARLSESQTNLLQQKQIDPRGIFGPVGCEYCGHTGYKGRVGIFDFLKIDEELKKQITEQKLSLSNLRQNGVRVSQNNLRKLALRLAIAGTTSLEEVKRVTRTVE